MKKELKNKIEEKLNIRPISHLRISNKNIINLYPNLNNNVVNNLDNFKNNFNINNNIAENLIENNPPLPSNYPFAVTETGAFKGRLEDYKFLKEIGKGAYAVVKSAMHRATAVKYAIKIYEKYKLMDPAKKAAVKREIQILKQVDHKNIVKMYEVIDTPKQVNFF